MQRDSTTSPILCACGCGQVVKPGNRFIQWHHSVRPNPIARLMANVDKSSGCWIWTGGRTSGGYGSISVRGKKVYVHRLAWQLFKGPIPPGMDVLHSCDNPPCFNPEHLFTGDQRDNARDMVAKGRCRFNCHSGDEHHFCKHPELVPRGERAGGSRLSEEQVLQIRALYDPGKYGYRKLAARFGVSHVNIAFIVKHQTWCHI